MSRIQIFFFGLGLVSLATLAGCEKGEEKLVAPATQEQAAKVEKKKTRSSAGDEQMAPEWTYEVSGEQVEVFDPEMELAEAEAATEAALAEAEGTGEEEPADPVTLFPPEFLAQSSAELCFFSMNTSSEFYQLKKMVMQLNEAAGSNISVTEYQMYDSEPYDSFVALLESGKQCDGIVLSGHHTDEFYGERSDGDLEVEDLEELACNPRYSDWFGNIKALWLQGCNTAKDAFQNEDLPPEERIGDSPIAQMERLMDLEDVEDSVEDMHDLLEDNINRDNMVNHYMRVFSGATVYGWSNIAPGEEAGAQKSIPYHIAQVSRLVENEPQYFQNPLQSQIPPQAAERYSQVLYGILKRPGRPASDFPEPLNETTFIQGWRDHGNVRYRYTFDNHHIEAFPALVNSKNMVLKQLKGLTCLLQQLDDMDDMSTIEVANFILKDRALTTYNTHLLWAMLRKTKWTGTNYEILRELMANNDFLVNELKYTASTIGTKADDAREFLAMLKPAQERMIAQPEEQRDDTTAARDTGPYDTSPWYEEEVDTSASDEGTWHTESSWYTE